MPKNHPPYSPEFRQRIVELVRKGRTPEELARQFEPSTAFADMQADREGQRLVELYRRLEGGQAA